jgi:hypothetical protein
MDLNKEYILDYLIINIVEDLLFQNEINEDLLADCYNHIFIDRAREIIPSKKDKSLFIDRIFKSEISKNESNILFNIIQAYEISDNELNSIKEELFSNVSGLFTCFSFAHNFEENDYLRGFKFLENNWGIFKYEELKYENPKKVKFENTFEKLEQRITRANFSKKWIYLFTNKAFEEAYNKEFFNQDFINKIIQSYNNHSDFTEKLKLKFLK